jgi:hypothetical protein
MTQRRWRWKWFCGVGPGVGAHASPQPRADGRNAVGVAGLWDGMPISIWGVRQGRCFKQPGVGEGRSTPGDVVRKTETLKGFCHWAEN